MLEEFLDSISKKSTRRVYRAGVIEFLNMVYGVVRKGSRCTSEEWIEYNKLSERYIEELKNGRNYLQDLLRFTGYLGDKPPLTAKIYVTGVKQFLFFNGFELSIGQSKAVSKRLPKGGVRTVEEELTREELQKILNQMDIKGRSFFLFLASSGCRIGEALKITLEDINLESEPVEVTVRGEYTKSGKMRTTYISKEAKNALLEWLKVRDKWLNSSKNKNKGLLNKGFGGEKTVEDSRVFPFNVSTAHQMWFNALDKSGLLKVDRATNRRTLHPHMLRKWFLSQSKLVIPVEISEALAGHSGYLSDAYRRYSKEQIREYYLKAEAYLYVFVPREISEIQSHFNKELEEQRERINKLTEQLNDALFMVQKLQLEREELRNEIEKQRREFDEIVQLIGDEQQKVIEKLRELEERLGSDEG
ncbi:MAG: tyrosine-type recombinase/integrase [Candidatus Freyarchaeota archaeon]